ncbi:MAG: GNAT family N-acetyltransferase [Peptostreptococcaceae bacterium]|nr:GNAT family N-acetyltransferase [Peptostreptococcaceae bacterium]
MINYKNIQEDDYYKMTTLIEKLADESNYYPFTSDDYKVSEKEQRAFIQKMNIEKNCYIQGAFFKDDMIGIVYLYGGSRIRNYHSTTLGIGVLEKYKGKKIGTTLIQNAIKYAYNCDVIGKINVQVVKENTKAINFYKNNGFVLEGVEKRALFIDDLFYDCVNMGYIVE